MNTHPHPHNKIIILDRDGVINQDSDDFIKSPDEWVAIDGSLEAISRLSNAGYAVYVLSNQSGIARGLFSLMTLESIHEKMIQQVENNNGKISGIYFCPHGPKDHCDCRKPLAGLYEQLAADLGFASHTLFKNVPSIGDSIRDLEAATVVGATPILVQTGKGRQSQLTLQETPEHHLYGVNQYVDLAAYVDHLLMEDLLSL